MRRLLTVVLHDGTEHDIELMAPESTPMTEIVRRFTEEWGEPPPLRTRTTRSADGQVTTDAVPPALFVAGDELPAHRTLAESPLRDGVRVGFGRPQRADVPPGGEFEVRFVAGEGAGTTYVFTEHELRAGAAIHVDQDRGRGVMLRRGKRGRLRVTRLSGDTVVQLDGRAVIWEPVWRAGHLLTVDRSVLEFGPVAAGDPVRLTAGDGGALLLRRPPRLPMALDEALRLDEALDAFREAPRTPGRWGRKKPRARASEPHSGTQSVAAILRRFHPDAAEVGSIAALPGPGLWGRLPSDPVFLSLRWGHDVSGLPDEPKNASAVGTTARRPFTPALPDGATRIGGVFLAEHGVIGVAGPGDRPRRLAAWFAAQIAVLHSPEHVVPRVFTTAEGAADWRWLRWLPRSSSELDEQDAPRVLTAHTEQVHQVGALLRLVAERQRAGTAAGYRAGTAAERARIAVDRPWASVGRSRTAADGALTVNPSGAGTAAGRAARGPDVVLILDGARRLLTQPGITRLLREGPQVGVHAICVESEVRALPTECRAVLGVGEDESWYEEPGEPRRAVLPDLPFWPWFDRVARALAPLRDADAEQRAYDLRESPLPELLGLEVPDPRLIAARWSAVPRSTAAVVGRSRGAPFELDLRVHGPHALIAGTAGSGKSEFLRTWVTSLAVANRPDELMFVLVDYKGSTAFAPLAGLPHVSTVIADLDSRQADRVLTRLGAALRDREAQLATYGAKDIEDYQVLRDRRDLPPLPRLVLVVDEFSPLVREFPDFLSGLVATAQRGRSLGVHLVLATQRPAGVLSPDLLATTNLRIALRLVDEAESTDIIDAPDAAAIRASHPGRAFARTGADDLVEFQTAALGDRPLWARSDATLAIRTMDAAVALPPPRRAFAETDADAAATDLDRLVEAVREAARHLGTPAPPGPLPPPLPTVVRLSELPMFAGDASAPVGGAPGLAGDLSGSDGGPPVPAGGPLAPDGGLPGRDGGPSVPVGGPSGHLGPARDLAPVAFGVEEVPDELAQRAAVFDLTTDTALAVAGASRSGRSQFLRTLAAALARRHSTADVHLFGIDCGDGALQALTGLPHCGAVVTSNQPERLARLLGRLTATVYARRQLLAAGGFDDIAAQRQAVPAAQRLPYLVLLLDRWDEFEDQSRELDDGQLVAELQRLLADGAGPGVRVVLTGGARVLSGRMARLVRHQLALNLTDRQGYTPAGIDPVLVPYGLGPGRAFRGHSAVEVQIALLDGPPTTRGQTDALSRLAAEVRARDAAVPEAQRPFRIDDTPRAADQFHVGAGRGRPVGREDVLAWLRDRHATGASAALLGPRRAGKTWVLAELSRRLVADGFRGVHQLVVPLPSSAVDSPDALAAILDREVRDADSPAEALLDKASAGTGPARLVFLLDEVGRLERYGAAAVSWLRDLGQAGAWLVYTGTEKDWRAVVRHALTVPGSSFGNDVNARALGPLGTDAALDFLSGTAANLGVSIGRDTAAARIVEYVGTWPFYLQVVGDAVVRSVQRNELLPLTSPEALHALVEHTLLDGWTQNFDARWTEIGPAGRAALLAEPGAVPRDASLAQRQDLRDVGLLRPGEQWLHDPPFFRWIARNHLSLRDGESPT